MQYYGPRINQSECMHEQPSNNPCYLSNYDSKKALVAIILYNYSIWFTFFSHLLTYSFLRHLLFKSRGTLLKHETNYSTCITCLESVTLDCRKL